MNKIIDFKLISETSTIDSTGQSITTPKERTVIGEQLSVYQEEFFKAEQGGIRSRGMVKMSAFDYEGEKFLKIGNEKYTIYRTFERGTDRIELYYGERVGNG